MKKVVSRGGMGMVLLLRCEALRSKLQPWRPKGKTRVTGAELHTPKLHACVTHGPLQ